MGRSSLQGCPWHYEEIPYRDRLRKSSIKRCPHNKGKCNNTNSKYYKKQCVGISLCKSYRLIATNAKLIKQEDKQNCIKTLKKTSYSKENSIVFTEDIISHDTLKFVVEDYKSKFYNKSSGNYVIYGGRRYKIIEVWGY